MPFDNPRHASVGDLEILIEARARISRQELWVRNRFEDGQRHCLVAALSLACDSRGFNYPNRTEKRLCRAIAKNVPSASPWRMRIKLFSARSRLVSFNDYPSTTHDDVLALLDRTIWQLTSRVPERVSV